jgi:NADPH:quinone reductase-like Zn-dependent oxidoreductase
MPAPPVPPAEARRIVFPAVRRAECSVVSAGTETANYAATHIDFRQPGRRVPLPFRPGYALAGTVVAVGSAVQDLRPGHRVAASANYADWVVVGTNRTRMVRLPDGVTGEQGCLARLSCIAMQGVRLARVAPGERRIKEEGTPITVDVSGGGNWDETKQKFLVSAAAGTPIHMAQAG